MLNEIKESHEKFNKIVSPYWNPYIIFPAVVCRDEKNLAFQLVLLNTCFNLPYMGLSRIFIILFIFIFAPSNLLKVGLKCSPTTDTDIHAEGQYS